MSNSSSSEVKIEKDDGALSRWGRGTFYRQEGNKLVFKSELMTKIVIGLTIVLAIVMMFKDSPYEVKEPDTALETPNQINQFSTEVKLEAYSEPLDKPKSSRKRKHLKIEPLKIVSRENIAKIPLGLSAKAKLLTGGTNGAVKAILLDDIELNGEVFIKEGTTLWGYGNSTEERLLVNFSKFVDKNGMSHKITASAYDHSDEILGLKGSIIGRTSKKIAAGAGLGVAGALHSLQQAENLGGVPVTKPSLENALLGGASTAALGIAEQELEDLKNKQSIIEVKKGTEFVVVFGDTQNE